MAYKHRRWTKEEDVKLKKLYNQKTLKKLAIIFDRTPNKVGRRAMKLGIKKDKKAMRLEWSRGQKRSYQKGRSIAGNKNPNWKGGRMVGKDRYVYIYCPKHPSAMYKRYVLEHRLVMEKHLGRYLDSKEFVHHLNHDRGDNRIENLALCASHSSHMKTFHVKQSIDNLTKNHAKS